MKPIRILALFLALSMLFSLAACSGGSDGGKSETITVTDHAGNEVTVPREINRIVVCDIYPLPSVLAVFFDSAEKRKLNAVYWPTDLYHSRASAKAFSLMAASISFSSFVDSGLS